MTLIKCGYHCSLLKCINSIFQHSSKPPLLHQPTAWRCRISIFSFRKKSFHQHLRTPGYNHTSKRFLKTDQAAEKEGAKLPLKYKVLLVSSGVLAVGYYCVHTATHSDVPAKPWQANALPGGGHQPKDIWFSSAGGQIGLSLSPPP